MKEKLYPQQEVETQIKDIELVRKKRLQIAEGATTEFIKKGYFKTSIRDISKATGLTIGNLYDYITKKEDILYFVVDLFHDTWINRLEKDDIFKIEDPAEQLKTAIQRMLELVNAQREMILFIYTQSRFLPKNFLKITLKGESKLIECFENILTKGIEKGVFRIKSPFLLANIIVYLLAIEPLRGWSLKKQYSVEEINKQIIEFIFDKIDVKH